MDSMQTCEDACRCRLAHTLYAKLYAECEEYSRSFHPRVLSLVQPQSSASSLPPSSGSAGQLLKSTIEVWQEYIFRVRLVCRVFLYLDRVYVLSRSELASIWDFCMAQFRTNVMLGDDAVVQTVLMEALLTNIREDRLADISPDARLIAQVVQMLTDLGLFETWAHHPLLIDAETFFIQESSTRLLDGTVEDFLHYARRRIDDEALRCDNYGLSTSFKEQLMKESRRSIFVAHLNELLQRGLRAMIEASQMDNLRMLFGLCQETDSTDTLRRALSELIKQVGITAISSTDNNSLSSTGEENVMASLIIFKDHVDRCIEEAFQERAIEFREITKDAFESVMNSRHNRPAELLARYVDHLLKGNSVETMTTTTNTSSTTSIASTGELQLDPQLDKVITMFRFLQGKDYFEVVFKKDLARRLLFGRSISLEVEKNFVGRLKQECGSVFTSRLEGMFKDMEQSKNAMQAYRPAKSKNAGDFAFTTIASGLWPHSSPLEGLILPPTVLQEQTAFEAYYKSQHKGRLLAWHQGLGNVILKANFSQGTKELQLTIPQALLLLACNEGTELSYITLQALTGLDDVTMVRGLQSLACGRVNILLKNPPTRDISPQDCFSFNADFTSRHQRIRINMLAEREGGPEAMISPGEGVADRPYLVDAAIVRLLKANKRMDRSVLFRTVFNNLPMGMSVSEEEFNKRCDSLMDREFIGKDPENPTVFIYVQ